LGHSWAREVRAQGLGLWQGSSSSPTAASHHTSSGDSPSIWYWSITKSYFCKAHGVLLLYISSLRSFLSIHQWIEDIRLGRAHGCPFCETSAKDGTSVVE
ncbi:RASEF protein, partial [Prunella fulvescens]|nr:RASEF protein [Prunella fulvescens]